MKKKKFSLKSTLTILFSIILILGGLIITVVFFNRTHFNPKDSLGNTPGNLNNKGLFCEYKNKIYFSNPYDNNALYVMNSDGSNVTILNSDQVSGINVYGNYIFYSRNNQGNKSDFSFLQINTKSLCRTNLDGKNLNVLDSEPTQYPALIGNYLYYQHFDKSNIASLYQVKIDGTEKKQLLKEPVIPTGISKNGLYYNNVIENLHMFLYNPITEDTSKLYSENSFFIVPDGEFIYFINCNQNYTLCRYNINTKEVQQLTSDRVDCYNICNNNIYYQTAEKNNYGLYRCEKDGANPILIKKGVFTNINVTSKMIFFQKFRQDTPIYYISTDGDLEVQTFTPQ
ncbi:DUF5050 domain-containing protein [Anaerosacchariphilus polymeriproducens]|uniref:DUF5050 domain-containing protein n=1 Tax=Anaerosacchariphilus polymeriproducens TaxID=1812858 RepID=A0A371AS06_9FIRM|nr:DUF5050 domain-containing protein [Anaerosacchariphilus polymeriproducens]RDU22322.1 DUF5050 domain-containing protein [Anaerosacchariphilus polymeriproducens]